MQLEEPVGYLYISAFQQKNKGVTDNKYGILLTLLELTSVKTSHVCEGSISR